jgi:nucleoid DNA-binding protein
MNISRRTLAREVAADTGLPYRAAYAAVSHTFDLVAKHIVALDRVTLHRLGVFEFKRRGEFKARNFQTGQRMRIPAHRQVMFRPTERVRFGVMRAG